MMRLWRAHDRVLVVLKNTETRPDPGDDFTRLAVQ